jgi:hypothetical protein
MLKEGLTIPEIGADGCGGDFVDAMSDGVRAIMVNP